MPVTSTLQKWRQEEHSEFEAPLSCIRPCLKISKQTSNKSGAAQVMHNTFFSGFFPPFLLFLVKQLVHLTFCGSGRFLYLPQHLYGHCLPMSIQGTHHSIQWSPEPHIHRKAWRVPGLCSPQARTSILVSLEGAQVVTGFKREMAGPGLPEWALYCLDTGHLLTQPPHPQKNHHHSQSRWYPCSLAGKKRVNSPKMNAWEISLLTSKFASQLKQMAKCTKRVRQAHRGEAQLNLPSEDKEWGRFLQQPWILWLVTIFLLHSHNIVITSGST